MINEDPLTAATMTVSDPQTARRYRCLAFDAVGTLIHPVPSVTRVYFEAACRHGSCLSEAEIAERFHRIFRSTEREGTQDWNDLAATALITSEEREYERWQEIVARVIEDARNPEACFRELYEHFARPESWQCFEDVGEVLAQLSADGYHLLIASNFDHRLELVRRCIPELQPVQRVVISADVGYRKPSRGFYQALFAAGGCRPDELLMIGDDDENDVLAARAAGASGLLIVRKGELPPGAIRSLRELPGLL